MMVEADARGILACSTSARSPVKKPGAARKGTEHVSESLMLVVN